METKQATKTTKATLVIGGTGKTGRRVVDRLQARGLPVRIGSRAGDPPFDWERPDSWAGALRGVDAVYLTYYPDVAAEGASDVIRAFVELARRARCVPRLVLLSGRGEDEAERCEEIVRRSGLPFTIVRSSWFSQNFSENFWLDDVRAGELAAPAGEVGEPFAGRRRHRRRGGRRAHGRPPPGPAVRGDGSAPVDLCPGGGGDRAGHRPGHPLRADPQRRLAAALREAMSPSMAKLISYLFDEVLDGRNASISDGVMRALGRPPRDFGDYARATAATGVWSPAGLSEQATRAQAG